MDCETLVLDNGADALRAVRDWRPELAFLDIGMPEIDGYEVARPGPGARPLTAGAS